MSSKRSLSSTASEMDTSTNALDQSVDQPVFNESTGKHKQKKKKPPQKQRKLDEFVKEPENIVENEDPETPQKQSPVEKKIDEINKKLTKMLTKQDSGFIRDIIRSTLEEMKDRLLASVTKRVEILEGELHEKCVQTEKLKQEIKARDTKISALISENKELKAQVIIETKTREKETNDIEQYSRRNNIRIKGIKSDSEKEKSDSVIKQVVNVLNEKGNLGLTANDIDVAHRLGKWKTGQNRSVIVKFVRRQTKIEVMKVKKELRKDKLFVNEDLTWLNQQVLASLRLKDPENVSKCWSFEGKLYALYRNSLRPVEIKFKDYGTWLDKPWPQNRIN